LIATCEHIGINTFDYLVALQRHAEAVKQCPSQWLPWSVPQAHKLSIEGAVGNFCGEAWKEMVEDPPESAVGGRLQTASSCGR